MLLQEVVGNYMERVPEVRQYCERCLRVERYGGNVVLMLVDASFVSLGLNYFTVVVPKVFEFKREFVDTNKISNLRELTDHDLQELTEIWKNRRSWNVAKEISGYLSSLAESDREALSKWAKNSSLRGWNKQPIGNIKGVGINTYQYLRMMGGVDTVMPDKIVKKVFHEIFQKKGMEMPSDDIGFVKKIEEIAGQTGFRAIELCWMTWLVQYDKDDNKMKKYSQLMNEL